MGEQRFVAQRTTLRYLSVCSGIEAASAAWAPLGWTPVAFADIDPFASAVLAHHYPEVPNLGDFTKIGPDDVGQVDLLVGGTPCQSFSLAGARAGLADPRGNLTLEFLALAERIRPTWIVWENVPGVLSIDGGRTFGTFLGTLGELGYGFAYRVLDAQNFGVPQRRRRVFVVGYFGDAERAAAVLFESASLSGHPTPRRETRKDVAGTLSARSTAGGGLGSDFEIDGGLAVAGPHIANTLAANAGRNQIEQNYVMHTLRARYNAGEDGTGRGVPLIPVEVLGFGLGSDPSVYGKDVSLPVTGRHGDPGCIAFQTRGSNVDVGDVSGTIGSNADRASGGAPMIAFAQNQLGEVRASEDVFGTITTNAHASGRNTPMIAFSCKDSGNDAGDIAPTLRSLNHDQSHANGGGQVAVAYPILEPGSRTGVSTDDVRCGIGTSSAVRRLTPRECTRLQGFPDDYLTMRYADAEEAHAAQILHELWNAAGAIAREGWRPGVVAALLTPEILLAGVYGGWVSWEMARRCAAARRTLQGAEPWPEGFVFALRDGEERRSSPYRRESFEQCARELGRPLSSVPPGRASCSEILRRSGLWAEAQALWPLRYALATPSQIEKGRIDVADGPKYRALGNSMAVPVMRWIGERIAQVGEAHRTKEHKERHAKG